MEHQIIGEIVNYLIEKGLLFKTPWLNSLQAASYMGLSKSYLDTLRSRDRGPKFTRVGSSRIFYKRDWLDEWLEGTDTTAGADKEAEVLEEVDEVDEIEHAKRCQLAFEAGRLGLSKPE